MHTTRSTSILSLTMFLLGFGFGALSLHVASAQGLLGLKTSVSQIGSSLVEMQKNVDELQQHMNTIKQAKEQLSSLASIGMNPMEKGSESFKQLMPGMGQ